MTDEQQAARNIASHLCAIHGEGKLSQSEKFGPILNIPCPDCLAKYGARELKSRHLGVRMSQFMEGTTGNVATCMKCTSRFTKRELLGMQPVRIRFPALKARTNLQLTTYKPPRLYPDERGVPVPNPPGTLTSLLELPPTHPAVWYLTNRGYSVEQLWRKYEVSFCTAELPTNPERNVYYRELKNGWRDTPQGRIVFKCLENGSVVNWQARLIEAVTVDNEVAIIHPDTLDWAICGKRIDGKTVWNEEFLGGTKKEWPPSKYKNASGSQATQHLYGIHNFHEYCKDIPRDKRYVVITEGILDADRFGDPGIPITGKVLSSVQAHALRERCDICVIAADGDEVGRKASTSIGEVASAAGMTVVTIFPPEGKKDFGECHPTVCDKMVRDTLARLTPV